MKGPGSLFSVDADYMHVAGAFMGPPVFLAILMLVTGGPISIAWQIPALFALPVLVLYLAILISRLGKRLGWMLANRREAK